MVKRQDTLGDLRNIALDAAVGDWITPFDDDDWSHPKRIEAMMQRRIDGHAVVVTSQVRYSIPSNAAYVYHNPQGCGGIMLYPQTRDRYEPMKKNEDSRFYLDNFSDKVVIWENRRELPHILLRFSHGGSISGKSHVMRKYANRKWHHQWVVLRGQVGAMNEPEIRYLGKSAVDVYEFNIGDAPLRALSGIAVQRDRENEFSELEETV
ncbi:MAG: glycosyltransferase, partial [Deltaproteobacteria bacterium]|nr:glycosyltransferase [Deltaproteobacteria bacterium]